jgi:hypothetical protein
VSLPAEIVSKIHDEGLRVRERRRADRGVELVLEFTQPGRRVSREPDRQGSRNLEDSAPRAETRNLQLVMGRAGGDPDHAGPAFPPNGPHSLRKAPLRGDMRGAAGGRCPFRVLRPGRENESRSIQGLLEGTEETTGSPSEKFPGGEIDVDLGIPRRPRSAIIRAGTP